MNATTQETQSQQEALINELLEGEDAGSYVVLSIDALRTQLRVALKEEARQCRCSVRCRQMDHGRLTYRIVRNLQALGFTRTKPS